MDLQSEYFQRHHMDGLVAVQDSVLLLTGFEKRKSLYLVLTSINPRSWFTCDKCVENTLGIDILQITPGNFSFSLINHIHSKDDNLLEIVRKQTNNKTLLPVRLKNVDNMIAYIWNHIMGSSVKTEKIRTAIMQHHSSEQVRVFLGFMRDLTTNRKYLVYP